MIDPQTRNTKQSDKPYTKLKETTKEMKLACNLHNCQNRIQEFSTDLAASREGNLTRGCRMACAQRISEQVRSAPHTNTKDRSRRPLRRSMKDGTCNCSHIRIWYGPEIAICPRENQDFSKTRLEAELRRKTSLS